MKSEISLLNFAKQYPFTGWQKVIQPLFSSITNRRHNGTFWDKKVNKELVSWIGALEI